MAETLSLPSSSYQELCKIVKGYSHSGDNASLDDLAKLIGASKSKISGNNKFLLEIGLIEGGQKKTATDLGNKLGRALDHEQDIDVKKYWREAVQGNAALSNLVTTVRIKGGMKEDAFAGQVLYVSGQKNTKENRTGSRAITDILIVAELLEEKDGNLNVSKPSNPETSLTSDVEASTAPVEPSNPSTPNMSSSVPQSKPALPIPSSMPSIAINIQLHLPETDNAEVYEKLFRALREQLISPKE